MTTKTNTHTNTPNAPSSLDDAIQLVTQIATIVGPAPALTAIDKQRATKVRKGADKIVPMIVSAVKHFGIQVPSRPVDAITTELAKAAALVPLQQRLALALKQVEDNLMLASSEAFASASAYYVILRRLAKHDGEVAKVIAPVEAFFATRHPLVKAAAKAKRGGTRKGAKAPPVTSHAPAAEQPPAHVADPNGATTDPALHASGGNAHPG